MWLRVDDGFLEHVKIIRAADVLGGPNALGRVAAVWLAGGLYASRNLTDGFIPTRVVARLLTDDEPVDVAEALVAAGLWRAVDGGYEFHDWRDWQPSGADVKAKRARDRDRKRAAVRSTGNTFREDSARNPRGVETDSRALARARDPVPVPVQRSNAKEPRALREPVDVFEVRSTLAAATHATVERGGEFVDADGAPNVGAVTEEIKTIAARDLGATWSSTRDISAIVASVVERRRKRDAAADARERFEQREHAAIRRIGGVR